MTTVTPLHRTRRAALFADPHLGGDLLLIALLLDHAITECWGALPTSRICEVTGLHPHRVRELLHEDMPHYERPERPRRCQYVGPRGGRCSRGVSRVVALPDPEDGTVTWVAACWPAHITWLERQADEHDRAVPPLPVYNTRSLLAGHFPEIDWPHLWSQLTTREPYDPARDPARGGAPLPQRPHLRLITA